MKKNFNNINLNEIYVYYCLINVVEKINLMLNLHNSNHI